MLLKINIPGALVQGPGNEDTRPGPWWVGQILCFQEHVQEDEGTDWKKYEFIQEILKVYLIDY